MRQLFTLPILIVMLIAPTVRAAENCIVGDPNDQSLVRIFNDDKNPDNGPIRSWRLSRKPGIKCEDDPSPMPVGATKAKDYFKDIEELEQRMKRNWSTFPIVSAGCVTAAMKSIDTGVMKVTTSQSSDKTAPSPNCTVKGKTMNCPTDAEVCDSDARRSKLRPGSSPCVTKQMAAYVAWMLSQAINCFSPENDQIDARTLVRKLNNESQFAFFITSRNGTGLHQIVKVMNQEMLAPERGYGEIIQPIKDLLESQSNPNPLRKKACETFREVINKTQPQSLDTKAAFTTCTLTQPGLGVARSVLLGVGNFAHVSYTYKVSGRNVSANSQVINMGFNPKTDDHARKLRDYIAMAYYSAAGPRGGMAALEVSRNNLDCDRKAAGCNSANMLEEFQNQMSAYYNRHKLPNYFKKIDQRYQGLLTRMDGGPSVAPKNYSEEEMRGDRCVE